MKKALAFCILLLSINALKAQYGYNYCSTLNATVIMGDSLQINLDGDAVPTAVIRTYVDPAYGRTARLVSLKPNSGTSYLRDVKFYTDGIGINNVERFANNAQISHSTSSTSTGPYVFRENVASNFGAGVSGYVAYMHRWFYSPAPVADTPEYSCTGWIRFSIGGTLDTVRVEATCGCDPQGIVAGQPSTYTTGLADVPEEHLRVVADGLHNTLICEDANLSYELYDALGRTLGTRTLVVGRNELDFPSGMHGMGIVAVRDGLGRAIKYFTMLY